MTATDKGTETFGPYTIESRREIAGGGFDALATDSSGKTVCLWVGAPGRVRLETGEGPEALVTALSRVYHSSLPRPLAADVIDDRAVLTLKAYRGCPLAERPPAGEATDVPEVLDQIRTVAGALVKAHRAGLVHGALDETEILLAEDGRTMLLHTGFGPFLGPRPPRAPEDLEGPPGESSDVFALSRVLIRCVEGVDPVGDATPVSEDAGGEDRVRGDERAATDALRTLPETTAEQFSAHLPQGLRRLLARAVHPDPRRRLSRAEELTGDLAVIRAAWEGPSAPSRPSTGLPIGSGRPLLWAAGVAVAGLIVLALALRAC